METTRGRVAFSHKTSRSGCDLLCIKTLQGVEIDFLFKGNDAEYIYIDGDEFPALSDTLYGLFVSVGGSIVSLNELRREAEDQWPSIREEIEREERLENRYSRELASPFLTGRV